MQAGAVTVTRPNDRTSDQTVLGSNPAVAAALSPWTRLFTPIVPRRSLHISFYPVLAIWPSLWNIYWQKKKKERRLLVRYSVDLRLQRVGSTLIERVLRFRWFRRTLMGKRLLFCMLLESNNDACSLSLSPRRRKGGVRMGHRRWTADVSLKACTSTSVIVRRKRPAPGQVMTASPTTCWAGCIFFACFSMSQDRTTTYTGWRHARQQPDFLLLFGTCGDSLSGTRTGDGAAEWIKTIVLSSPFSSTSNRKKRWNLEHQIFEVKGTLWGKKN